MKTLTTVWIVLLGISVLMSGCDDESHHTDALSAKINSHCIVYLNRQVLGESPREAVMPFLYAGGGGIGISGTLKQVTKEWIVLEGKYEEMTPSMSTNLWIPRNVVLCVRTDFKIVK